MLSGDPAATGRGVNAAARFVMKNCSASPKDRHLARFAAALGIVAITVLAYTPALRGGFIWDDDCYVTANQTLRSADGLKAIWLEPRAL